MDNGSVSSLSICLPRIISGWAVTLLPNCLSSSCCIKIEPLLKSNKIWTCKLHFFPIIWKYFYSILNTITVIYSLTFKILAFPVSIYFFHTTNKILNHKKMYFILFHRNLITQLQLKQFTHRSLQGIAWNECNQDIVGKSHSILFGRWILGLV